MSDKFDEQARRINEQERGHGHTAAVLRTAQENAGFMTAVGRRWKCIGCGCVLPEPTLELATAVCACGVGKGRWYVDGAPPPEAAADAASAAPLKPGALSCARDWHADGISIARIGEHLRSRHVGCTATDVEIAEALGVPLVPAAPSSQPNHSSSQPMITVGPQAPTAPIDVPSIVASGERERAARIVRAQPHAPGTTSGRRQAWVLENAARAIEGREPVEWVDPQPAPVERPALREWGKHGVANLIECRPMVSNDMLIPVQIELDSINGFTWTVYTRDGKVLADGTAPSLASAMTAADAAAREWYALPNPPVIPDSSPARALTRKEMKECALAGVSALDRDERFLRGSKRERRFVYDDAEAVLDGRENEVEIDDRGEHALFCEAVRTRASEILARPPGLGAGIAPAAPPACDCDCHKQPTNATRQACPKCVNADCPVAMAMLAMLPSFNPDQGDAHDRSGANRSTGAGERGPQAHSPGSEGVRGVGRTVHRDGGAARGAGAPVAGDHGELAGVAGSNEGGGPVQSPPLDKPEPRPSPVPVGGEQGEPECPTCGSATGLRAEVARLNAALAAETGWLKDANEARERAESVYEVSRGRVLVMVDEQRRYEQCIVELRAKFDREHEAAVIERRIADNLNCDVRELQKSLDAERADRERAVGEARRGLMAAKLESWPAEVAVTKEQADAHNARIDAVLAVLGGP